MYKSVWLLKIIMKVLMLGWEFPPFFAGGVGIVCYELTKALSKYDDVEVTYIMPYGPTRKEIKNGVKILFANKFENLKVNVKTVNTTMYCYDSEQTYSNRITEILQRDFEDSKVKSIKDIYGSNLLEEVYLYAQRVAKLCKDEDFDVIHAHDWTTIPAAILLKELTGKPVVLHVHITELNKTGGSGGNEDVFEIERFGFTHSDKLITVSHQIKDMLINHYGCDSSKIEVIHNGGVSDMQKALVSEKIHKFDKVVLYAGRVTLQKGPEYFLKAAKKVLEYEPDTKFVMIGSGDMLARMIELSAELGISKSVLFHGFYNRAEAEMFFSLADVFVMPSVLEPFGIVPLEAVAKGTPVVISKQSGISEVLENCFKVDFWDTDEMAHKILALVRYGPLHSHMRDLAYIEFDKFNWDIPAKKMVDIYRELSSKYLVGN